jgi:hypothetical protein
MEGQWEKKAVYTIYLEVISALVHLYTCALVYMLFFLSSMVHLSNYSVNYGWWFIILRNYGVPMQEIFLVMRPSATSEFALQIMYTT